MAEAWKNVLQTMEGRVHGAQTVLKTVAIRKGEGSIPLLSAREVARVVMGRLAKPWLPETAHRFESCTSRHIQGL